MDTGRGAKGAVGGRPVSGHRGVYISGSSTTPQGRTDMGKLVDQRRTSRSMESSRTRPVRRAPDAAAGSASSGARTSTRGPSSCSRRRWTPRPCCWGGGATSGSRRRWPSRTGDWADRLNSLPKYVVSSTLEDPEWTNSTVLTGDVVDDVSKLKEDARPGTSSSTPASQLVPTLLEHDLVDELRLMSSRSCSAPGNASSARPATRSLCASSATGPSATVSFCSPTSAPTEQAVGVSRSG